TESEPRVITRELREDYLGTVTMQVDMPMTEMLDYRARYYDPTIGRFLSEDPIGFQGGINVYRYVRNNPLLLIDPMGLCDFTSVSRIKLWSTSDVTILSPRSPWQLLSHQEGADGI